MNIWRSTIATMLFEIRRSLSIQRLMITSVLALFPPAMVMVIGFSGGEIPLTDLLILTLVAIVALLAQLLWATSNIYSELEGKSWIFVASRPNGRIGLFLGKYLSSVFFSFGICLFAVTTCLTIRMYLTATLLNPIATWAGMAITTLLACLVYSAVLSVIGTIFQKRAMVFGAAYLILSEIIIANVPAIISRFTARFHLQAIATDLLGWFLPISESAFNQMYGESSLLFHLGSIFVATAGLLTAGCILVVTRQYLTADET